MKILFIGDIVGSPGRRAVKELLPRLRSAHGLDVIIANGENSAGGNGITPDIAEELFGYGVDAITTGDHLWDQKEVMELLQNEKRFLRPLNYPPGTPGKGSTILKIRDLPPVAVMNVQGRTFMQPPLDNPFTLALEEAKWLRQQTPIIFVDFHAEATSEKMAMGQFRDGRVSCVVGSHSHVPTADTQILPLGTAYQTDAGACADYDSVIGMDKAEPVQRFLRKINGPRFAPATGPATVCGVFVQTGPNGLALRIDPVRAGGRLAQALPQL